MASATLCTVPCGLSGLSPVGSRTVATPHPSPQRHARHTAASPAAPPTPLRYAPGLPHTPHHRSPLRMPRGSQGNSHLSLGLQLTQEASAVRNGRKLSPVPLSCSLLEKSTIKCTLNCRQVNKMRTVPYTLKKNEWGDGLIWLAAHCVL